MLRNQHLQLNYYNARYSPKSPTTPRAYPLGTMAPKIPTLRKHTTGVWFVKWGGKQYYYTKDQAESQQRFQQGDEAGSLSDWLLWQDMVTARAKQQSKSPRMSIVDLIEQFLLKYMDEGRDSTMVYYRKHLTRFANIYGTINVHELDLAALRGFRSDLLKLKLSPKTVGHDINAVKTMLRWAADNELAPELRLRAIKAPFAPAPMPTRLSYEEVVSWMRRAHQRDRRLLPYLALNYLCLCRPSEVIRLINREGHFEPVRVHLRVPIGGTSNGNYSKKQNGWKTETVMEPRGVFVMERSKTEQTSGHPRYIVMTDQALAWFDLATPVWSRLDSYSPRVRKICGPGGPKLLQKAAAFHLQLQGVELADVDLLLGHEPSGVWRHYARREWTALRERAAQISL